MPATAHEDYGHTDGKHSNPAITEHTSTTGHKYTLAGVKVLVKEDSDLEESEGDYRHPQAPTSPEQSQPALNRATQPGTEPTSPEQRQRLRDPPPPIQLVSCICSDHYDIAFV